MSVPTSEHTSEHILNTERLEALVDGIFAFAMTRLYDIRISQSSDHMLQMICFLTDLADMP